MKVRLFLGFMLVILLGVRIGKEVIYNSQRVIIQCTQRSAPLPFSYPTKLPFQADVFFLKQFIH
ncbi:hypothetical protein DDE73_28170 (plasmid) [Bacillus thuringiensis]|nr:hypothetical protein DDE73_28170 [Bacillus thuringiensis]